MKKHINFKKHFLKLPYFIQFILYNIYGFKIKRKRYGKLFNSLLTNFLNSNRSEVNIDLLKSFLKNASQTEFWYERFKKYNIAIDSLDPIKEIKKLPILSKEEVKLNIDKIINSNYLYNSNYNTTSGTTGSGLKFPQTNIMECAQWAVWWRFRIEHKIYPSEWMAWFGGRTLMNIEKQYPPYWFKVYATKQFLFSIYHLNDNTIEYYLKVIKNNNISWIHGYPSSINLLSNLIHKNELKSYVKHIKFISVGGEMLHKYQFNNIRNTFNCKIITHYGLAEGVSNISLNNEDKLSPDQDFSFTEFIHKRDDIYKIIGTNYYNNAFPLIRYDTKDEIQLVNNQIISILGRDEDYITLKNGIKIGRLDHIFKDIVNIDSAQLFQSKDGFLTIFIIKGINFTFNDEIEIMNQLNLKFSSLIDYKISYVTSINKTNSGKHKFVISEII